MRRSLVVLAAVALAPSAHAGAITVKQVVPPPVVVTGVKSIQVADFSGRSGDAIAMEVRAELVRPDRVIDRANLGGMLLEGVTDGLGDAAEAAVGGGVQGALVGGLARGIGAMVAEGLEADPIVLDDGLHTTVFEVVDGPADASLTGNVDVASNTSNFKRKVAKRDANGKIVKDKDGKVVKVEVSCRKRTAQAQVRWSLTTASGQPLAQEAVTRGASDTKCGSDISQLASEEVLADAALSAGIGDAIAATLQPSWSIVKIDLQKDKGMKDDLKALRQDAQVQALCGIRGLVAFDEYYHPGVYNLGALHESLGWFDEARQWYRKAQAMKANKQVAKALARVDERQAEVATLSDVYGMEWTIGAADYSSCPEIPDGRRAALKRPTSLFTAAGGGDRVSDLPRGLRVFVTSESGGWLEVATLDGKRGWVEAKTVK